MKPTQGIAGHQAIQTQNNDIYGSAGSNSSSSYVSLSGVKSILSNAWNAIKSVFSDVLSSFGRHLSGQQGSAKPGREITMDTATRQLPQPPGKVVESDYATINFSAEVHESVVLTDESTSEPIYATVNKHAALSEAEQKKINLWEGITDGCESEVPPVPGDAGRTPPYMQTAENDPRGESDYADPRELLFGEDMLRQRYMSAMMKNQ